MDAEVSLTRSEMDYIRGAMGREPNPLEFECWT